MQNIVTRQKDTLLAELSIRGVQKFGGIALVGQSPLGQAGVDHFLKMTNKIKDPAMLELLRQQDPSLAFVMDNLEDADKIATASWNRVMGLPVAENAPKQQIVVEDAITRDIVKNEVEPVIRNASLRDMQAKGRVFKDIGVYAQKGARVNANKEEVAHVQGIWNREFEPLVSRIASALKANPNIDLSLTADGLRVEVPKLKAPATNFGFDVSVPSDLQLDIKRLNGFSNLVANNWAADVGEKPFGFAGRVINKIILRRVIIKSF